MVCGCGRITRKQAMRPTHTNQLQIRTQCGHGPVDVLRHQPIFIGCEAEDGIRTRLQFFAHVRGKDVS